MGWGQGQVSRRVSRLGFGIGCEIRFQDVDRGWVSRQWSRSGFRVRVGVEFQNGGRLWDEGWTVVGGRLRNEVGISGLLSGSGFKTWSASYFGTGSGLGYEFRG